jgi:hypothetical protein
MCPSLKARREISETEQVTVLAQAILTAGEQPPHRPRLKLKKPAAPYFMEKPSHMHGQNITESTSELHVTLEQAVNGCSERNLVTLSGRDTWQRK